MARRSANKLENAVKAMPHPDEMKWKAESAVRTLAEAEKIRKDPVLMKHVKAHARQEIKNMEKICAPKGKPSGR